MCLKPGRAGLLALALSFPITGVAMAETVVRPQFTVEDRYDSNPASGTGASSDFVTTLSPSLHVTSESRKLKLKGAYELSAVFYHNESDHDYTAQSASLEADLAVSNGLKVDFRDTLKKSRDSIVALDAGVQTDYAEIFSNTAELGFIKEITEKAALEITFKDSVLDFDSPSLVDTRVDGASAAWRYAYTDLAAFKMGYAYSRYHFETDGAGDEDVHKVSVELSKKFSESLSASLSAGLVLSGDGARADWAVDASAVKEFKWGAVNAGFTRDITHSSGLSGELSVANRLYAGAAKTLGESSGLTLSLSLGDTVSEPSGEVDIASYDAKLGSYWQPREWVRISGGYSHFEQRGEGASDDDFNRDQVFINVTLTPLNWSI